MNTAMLRLPRDGTWRGLRPFGCGACERGFLVAARPDACPLCGSDRLEPRDARVREVPPELQVDFAVSPDALVGRLGGFVRAPWFRVSDLRADRLAERAVEVHVPVWLVDATCEGAFEAEIGADYEVRSSDEVLEGGRWTTREVTRTRIRWSPAVGRVSRRYDNVDVPALAEHASIVRRLGGWPTDGAVPATGRPSTIVLPDRDPDEAWPDALDQLAHRVGDDVRRAVAADHVRGVVVRAEWTEREHTWMLLPMYATWYIDGSGQRCAVWIHGVTGQAWGPRRASMRKALGCGAVLATLATGVLAAAGVTLVIGLVVPVLLLVALVLGVLAVPLFVLALWPPLHVWAHNRRERVDLPRGS